MSKLILTADDSASMREMISFTLRNAGYDVVEAVDGQDALGKIAASSGYASKPAGHCPPPPSRAEASRKRPGIRAAG